jgi:hypothetical protein
VYRTRSGAGAVVEEGRDPRDYDVEHYARVLRGHFASKLARAFSPGDFEAVFAAPDQMSLFTPPVEGIQTVLNPCE